MWISRKVSSKIALQPAAPPDVERGAVEGAAKCGVVQELAWNRLESPFLHRTHCSRMMRIDDDALLVDHQHVHVEPFSAQRSDLEHTIRDRVGLRGHQDVPFFQDRRETVDVDIFW